MNSEARFKFEHCSTKRILFFFPLLLLFLAMHDFLMQSKTFPSYIWNSVCTILTQILRELMEVIFFDERLHRKFFTLLILYSAKTVGMPKLHKVIKNMRFDRSLLIFIFDIRCFEIKPKTCIDLDITTSVNCSHQHLYQLTIKL